MSPGRCVLATAQTLPPGPISLISVTSPREPRLAPHSTVAPRPRLAPRSRLGQAAVVGALVSLLVTQAPVPARAEGVGLDASLCQTVSPTPGAAIPKLWHLERLDLTRAWQLADGSGVTIAVIDTGVSNLNSALLDPRRISTRNYLPLDDKERLRPRGPGDTEQGINCTHGTNVTSIIVGEPGVDPRTSYSGVAPGAKVIAMRALTNQADDQGSAQKEDPSATIAAINDAVAMGVDVINISQAMSFGTDEYAAAVRNAIDHGVVVVASAGNAAQGLQGPAFPASYPGVIAVGMTNPQDQAVPAEAYQNSAMRVTVAAPGAGILALSPSQPLPSGKGSGVEAKLANQAYAQVSGTSFATPIVSGVVALMLQRHPGLTPAQVKQRLVETADPPVASVPDPYLGSGVVNPLRALTGPAAPTSGHPSSSPTPPPVPPRESVTIDRGPMWLALAVAAVALTLAGAGLVLRLVVPAAARRGFRAARPRRG